MQPIQANGLAPVAQPTEPVTKPVVAATGWHVIQLASIRSNACHTGCRLHLEHTNVVHNLVRNRVMVTQLADVSSNEAENRCDSGRTIVAQMLPNSGFLHENGASCPNVTY